ncbi:MAG: leucyl/phenylalanyl-tRNA--protein transferase [Acidiferrobacteraceae bacterium]
MFVLPAGDPVFPSPRLASQEGLLAVGGDLSPGRLLAAYRSGIFPWYNPGQPILWWSPDPRAVLFPDRLHISRSLRKTLRSGRYSVTFDTAFTDVIEACAGAPRLRGTGTWITGEMQHAYSRLHRLGYAHSVETWAGGRLAGGLYGVALGRAFFGESMFSLAPDASKVALVQLVTQLRAWGYRMIDCQMHSPHLTSLGASDLSRDEFLLLLEDCLAEPTPPGRWPAQPDGDRP